MGAGLPSLHQTQESRTSFFRAQARIQLPLANAPRHRLGIFPQRPPPPHAAQAHRPGDPALGLRPQPRGSRESVWRAGVLVCWGAWEVRTQFWVKGMPPTAGPPDFPSWWSRRPSQLPESPARTWAVVAQGFPLSPQNPTAPHKPSGNPQARTPQLREESTFLMASSGQNPLSTEATGPSWSPDLEGVPQSWCRGR